MGQGVVRVQPDRHVKIADRLAVLALVQVSQAPLKIRRGIVRIEVNGLAEIADGLVVLAVAQAGFAFGAIVGSIPTPPESS